MVSTAINYRNTYLEFPELTKLQGKPTSESIFKLRNELKANAQSVYSKLSVMEPMVTLHLFYQMHSMLSSATPLSKGLYTLVF
jgi:hypothetical protein